MRFLHAVAGVSLLFGIAVTMSCSSGTELDASIVHTNDATRGHVLFVSLHRLSHLDENGLPAAPLGAPPKLLLMKRLDDDSSSTSVTLDTGCLPEMRILAWIDTNETSGWAPMMDEGETLTWGSDDVRFDLGSIARPDQGDWIALSPPIQATTPDGTCNSAAFDVDLEPSPT